MARAKREPKAPQQISQESKQMSTFESILTSKTRLDDIKDVPPIPHGTYLAQINGPHEMIKSKEKQTDGAQIVLRFLQARDDVDQDALKAHLEASNRKLSEVEMKYVFWDSPYLEQSLRDFFRGPMEFDGDWSVPQCFGNIPGKNLLVTIVNKPFRANDGSMKLRAEVAGFARAE